LFHLFEVRNIRPIFLPVLYKRKVDIVRRTHKIEENKPSKEMINGNKSYCIRTQTERVPNGSRRVLSVFHLQRFERFKIIIYLCSKALIWGVKNKWLYDYGEITLRRLELSLCEEVFFYTKLSSLQTEDVALERGEQNAICHRYL
jgi:hypothetical protein